MHNFLQYILSTFLLLGVMFIAGKEMRLPQDGNTTRVPQNGNTARVPQDGNTTRVPQDGNTARVPQDGNTTRIPHEEMAISDVKTNELSEIKIYYGSVLSAKYSCTFNYRKNIRK